MKKRRLQKVQCTAIIAAAALAVFSIYPLKAFAIDSISLPVQVMGNDVVSIDLPVVSESEISVFDFIMDPQGLLYETDAVRYGGGRVEEGATLLFHNKEGEYDFSKHSDWLTVTNRSTVPVRVTVTAQVMDMGEVRLAGSSDFGESTEPEVYLAIEDDQGNIQPLSADEQAAIHMEMSAAPENTYVFRIDEENHTYQYGMSMDSDMVDFDTYSFGLIGACNSNAEWRNISIHPTITVTWYVDPIISEEQEEISEEEFVEEKNGSATGDDIEDNDVSADKPNNENGEDNVSGGLDDEEQPDGESEDESDEDNANDGSDDEKQLDDESEDESEDENGESNTSDD